MATKYFISGGTDNNWNTANNWSPVASVPANGDDVIIGVTSPNCVINGATNFLNSLEMTGYAATLSGSAPMYIRPANGSSVTVRVGGTVTWSGTLYLDTILTTDTATINFYSGGITTLNYIYVGNKVAGQISVSQQDNISLTGTASVFELDTGTWTTNNNNITAGAMNFTTAGTKALAAGSSTFTLSNATTPWNYSGSNMTITGTSTISITIAGNPKFVAGGATYYNINRTGTAVTTDGITFNGNFTIDTGGTLTLVGNSIANRLLIQSSSYTSAITITNNGNTPVISYTNFRGIAFGSSINLSAITGGSGDCGGNSNITFTTADTETWDGTTNNWGTAHWTGGSVSRIPLPQDTVILAGTNTITANMPILGKDISFSAAAKLTLGVSVFSGGNLDFTNAGTYTPGSYNWGFNLVKNCTITLPSGNFTAAGIISDAGGAYGLTWNNSGILTLSGANTFTGKLFIKNGTVRGQTSANAFGASTAADSITLGDTSGSNNATLDMNAYTLTIANPITVGSGSSGTLSIAVNVFAAGGTLSGAIVLNHDLTISMASAVGSRILYLSGGITGTGNLTLNNSDNSGGIIIQTNPVNMTGTITNLSTSTNSGANGALNINSVIGTNVTAINQNGPSLMLLSGTNTFTGPVSIKAGTILLGNANALGTSTNAVTLGDTTGNADAKLNYYNTSGNATFANPITVASGSSGVKSIGCAYNNVTFGGAITLNTGLTIFATGGGDHTTITGGITGTGNLILQSMTAGDTVAISTTGVNMIGTITNSGAGTGLTTISSNIGSNVTSVTQSSTTSTLLLSGTNGFGTLTLGANTTTKIAHSTTTTVSNLVSNGTLGNLAVLTSDNTVAGTLAKSGGGTVAVDYLNLSYNTGSPGSTFYYGSNSTIGSGVTGWTTGSPPSGTNTGMFAFF